MKLQIGGTVPLDALYVERPADEELPAALLRGEYCYVLAPRQIGKSSLQLRAADKLKRQGVRCAALDLTRIGSSDATSTQWYSSMCEEIAEKLDLKEDPEEFTRRYQHLSPVQRFVRFLQDEVLMRVTGPVVVFIDEIDTTRTLRQVSRDDFFSALRALYNGRAEDQALSRLTFCLLGVAQPSDLIEDETRTPFNIGRAIVLEDFNRRQMDGLAPGLPADNAGTFLDEIYRWTDGHPYMTAQLCQALFGCTMGPMNRGIDPFVSGTATVDPAMPDTPAERVEGAVRRLFFVRGRVQDSSLSFAEKHFNRDKLDARVHQMLALYERIVGGESVGVAGGDPVQLCLRLTGMAAERHDAFQGGLLRVRNQIFATVFDSNWVRTMQAERLFAGPLTAWLAEGKPADRLLRGADLSAALEWSARRADMTHAERAYLRESERQQERQAGRRLLTQVLGAALALVVVLLGVAVGQYLKARNAAGAEVEQRRRAERAALVERGIRAHILAKVPGRKAEALLLSLQAIVPQLEAHGEPSAQNVDGLFESVNAWIPSRPLEGYDAPSASVAFSPDGNKILMLSAGVVRILDAQTGRMQSSLTHSLLGGHVASMGGANMSLAGQTQRQSHQGWIQETRWSPDGRKVYTLGEGVLRLWDARTWQLLWEKSLIETTVLGFSSSGESILATDGLTVSIWNTRSGSLVSIVNLKGEPSQRFYRHFSVSGQLLAERTDDRRIYVWDLQSGRRRAVIEHESYIRSLVYSPNGRLFFTATEKLARVWDMHTGKRHLLLPGMKNVEDGAFSPDGKRLVTISDGQMVRIWDMQSGSVLSTATAPTQVSIFRGSFSPDGRSFITPGRNSATAWIWNAQTGLPAMSLEGAAGEFLSATFSPDGKRLASIHHADTARLWELANERPVRTIDVSSRWLSDVRFSPDGALIMVSASDGIYLWDVHSSERLLHIKTDLQFGLSAAFSPDGSQLVTSGVGVPALWDLKSGQPIIKLLEHWYSDPADPSTPRVFSSAFAPDGRRVVTNGEGPGLRGTRIWDVQEGRLLKLLGAEGAFGASFSPDGSRVIANEGEAILVWNSYSGQRLLTLTDRMMIANPSPVHVGMVPMRPHEEREVPMIFYSIAFSPDGSQIAAGCIDGAVRLWDSGTGRLLAILVDTVTPTRRRLPVVAVSGATRSHDASSGELTWPLRRYEAPVRVVAYAPDGRHLLSLRQGRGITIWDTRSQSAYLHIEGEAGSQFSAAAFSADGRYIATTNGNGSVVLYTIALPDLLQFACSYVGEPATQLSQDVQNYCAEHTKRTRL